MRARLPSLTTTVLTALTACLLAGTAPALAGAGTDGKPDGHGATYRPHGPTSSWRPQASSDGEPGLVAPPVPAFLRTTPAARTDLVRWRVAPGVFYRQWDQRDPRGPIRAHLLTIDPSTPGVRLDYASKGAVRDTAPLPDILAVDRAVAGVNGDFYDIGDTGAPLGLGLDLQRGLLHARRAGWNSAFYLDSRGVPQIGTLPLRAQVAEHPDLRITNDNSPFVKPGGIGIYTHGWGRTDGYRVTEGQRRHVRMVVVADGRVRSTTTSLGRDGRISGLVLIGRGKGARALAGLKVGSRATVGWRLAGAPRMAISGNRFLVDDGVVQVVDDRDLQPRTAVGIDRDTGQVLLLVIDGRRSWSHGATMVELANLMIDLGADEALNLDGGGSSTMVARKPDGRRAVVNTPSDGFLRWVSNALEVTYTPPKQP